MDYKKKMIVRLIFAICYTVFGAGLIIVNLTGLAANEMISSFGAVFTICGIVRLIQYFRITKNKDRMEQREIEEEDERNVMLWTNARSMAFSIYSILAGCAILVLFMMNMEFAGQIIAYTLCALVFIYWICYMVLRRKY